MCHVSRDMYDHHLGLVLGRPSFVLFGVSLSGVYPDSSSEGKQAAPWASSLPPPPKAIPVLPEAWVPAAV